MLPTRRKYPWTASQTSSMFLCRFSDHFLTDYLSAYGDAAGFCLEYFHILDNNPENKLGCLIAYYPNLIPDPQAPFPSNIEALVHLAGEEVGVVKHSQLAGAKGKRRVVRKDLEKGPSRGRMADVVYPCYKYDAEPGFAEQDLDDYDSDDAALAWNRSLTAVKKAFRRS